jgi:hypothetical protein
MANVPVIMNHRTHQSRLRWLGIVVALLALAASTGFASGKIDPYLPAISEYRFEKQEEITSLEGRQRLGPFSAEILEEYDLRGYSRWHVHHPEVPEAVEMEVYQLLDSPAAYGIFTMWNSGSQLGREHQLDLPVENHFQPGRLTFWRGHFFINLQGIGEEPHSREGLEALGTGIVGALPLANARPLTLTQMPAQEKQDNSVRFYLGPAALSLNPAFPKELLPLLGFEDGAEITFAQYGEDQGSLFLVGYPTPSLAVDHAAQLEEAVRTQFSESGVYVKRSGFLVALFFGQEAQAQQVLAEINYSPQIKWVYDKYEVVAQQTENPVPFLLKLIIGTLLTLAVALVIGLIVGLIRFLVLRRYPDFGYYDKMVTLKINNHEKPPERGSETTVPSGS